MAKKQRQYNVIRTDYLEEWIGFYSAYGRRIEEQLMRTIARDVFAPISEEHINRIRAIHESAMEKQSQYRKDGRQ